MLPIYLLLSLYLDTDRDFEPSAELLIREYDDEATMEEEENLSGASGDNEELDDLQKVGVVGCTNLTHLYSCVYGRLYLPPE